MSIERNIKEEEKTLIAFLLEVLQLPLEKHPVATEVTAYEDDIMGSIFLGRGEPRPYARDLIRVLYHDIDGTPVVITLTQDLDGNLLDLDFWKQDFSKLLKYPHPNELQPYNGL